MPVRNGSYYFANKEERIRQDLGVADECWKLNIAKRVAMNTTDRRRDMTWNMMRTRSIPFCETMDLKGETPVCEVDTRK